MADSNKSEKPTARRRQKAREKGQVARTRDLSGILAIAAACALIGWQASHMAEAWRTLLQTSLSMPVSDVLAPRSSVLFWSYWEVIRWAAPVMLDAWVISAVTGVAQGGFVFAPEALAPNPERLSPVNRLQQIFSISALGGLLKSLPPIICVIYVSYGVFHRHMGEVVRASNLGMGAHAQLMLTLLFEVGWKSLLVLVIFAAIDYLIAWRKHEGDLKMSREELREEMKETDGNPQIKARIRRLQRQVRRRQMLLDTEQATVVVTNPTHFAVALKYEPMMAAPIVVAKGRDLFAQEIKDVARWSNVPIMENPPLAQALYRLVAVNGQIPAKLYTAVAEILAFVYKAQVEAARRAARPRNK